MSGLVCTCDSWASVDQSGHCRRCWRPIAAVANARAAMEMAAAALRDCADALHAHGPAELVVAADSACSFLELELSAPQGAP